jgi:uncharacterized membrane protein YhaH (DUF805 family)
VESFHDLALRPLRRATDFRGRSRRQELIAFYILYLGVNLIAKWIGAFFGAWDTRDIPGIVVQALLALPACALFVRRLHDSGRRGWWVLLGVPAVAGNLWRESAYRAALPVQGPWDIGWLMAIAGLALLTLFALLLWDDDPEPNRYGPNPRFDPPEPETTQPATYS